MAWTVDEAVEVARRVAERSLAPRAEEIDRDARWPQEGLAALREAGLGGLVVPVDAGGQGLGLRGLAQVTETLAQACASTAVCFGMHCVGTAVIAAQATDEQRTRYLQPIARGEHLTSLALSEPGTGVNFYIPETRLEPAADGGYTLTGTKSFVTNGARADSYVVSAAPVAERATPGEFSLFLIPGERPGLAWGDPWAGWGLRGNSARTLTMKAAKLSRADLLGREGDEIWFTFNVVVPYFIIALSGAYLGLAADALEQARRHVLQRAHEHSGLTLARQPLVQNALGELWAEVERTRALIDLAAKRGDAGDRTALMTLCAAKAEVARCVEHVASESMKLMGGRAYGQTSRIQRIYRDARAAHLMAPTTEQCFGWAGRQFLGLPLLGERG